jgi:hypothetical protein
MRVQVAAVTASAGGDALLTTEVGTKEAFVLRGVPNGAFGSDVES